GFFSRNLSGSVAENGPPLIAAVRTLMIIWRSLLALIDGFRVRVLVRRFQSGRRERSEVRTSSSVWPLTSAGCPLRVGAMDDRGSVIFEERAMSTNVIERQFTKIGARARVHAAPAPSARTGVSIDVGRDAEGEFFDIAIGRDAPAELMVLDAQPRLRHLLLM